MGRFYFNFRQNQSYAADEDGMNFPCVETAYLAAVEGAREMWPELLARREDPLDCAFEVTDRNGEELFTLPFSEVLDACRKDRAAAARPANLNHPNHINHVAETLEIERKARTAMDGIAIVMAETRATLRETARLLALAAKTLDG